MSNLLFSNKKLGRYTLKNRVAMAPMTRCRAIGNIPNDSMATYYAQRAEAGLLITEGTAPSLNGLGYARIPGIFTDEQVKGWKKVTDAVHKKGSVIFVQIMHTGRASHKENMAAGARILAPSAISSEVKIWTDAAGEQLTPVPFEMTDAEVEATIEEFVKASERAIEAGFDGVELHGANGYLIDQFINTASNQRTDKWGGNVENRMRFILETTKRVAAKIGPDRVGVRLSPYGTFNTMKADADMDALYETLAKRLSELNIAYLHVVDQRAPNSVVPTTLKQKMRQSFPTSFILSGGYDEKSAEEDLSAEKGDVVAFGRPFISNPDLVTKMQKALPLTQPDFSTFYTPGEKGYVDYV